MKKMLMAFALCASMMLPGQDNPPEGMDTLSFPLMTFECIFLANHDDETDEDSYWEMRIGKSELTNYLTLLITDFAEDDDIESLRDIWDSNMEQLHRATGL